ncbi:MAG: siderophore-interacting protein [Myxococcota bacterium]
MRKRTIHQLEVRQRDSVTPHLARVVLGGADLERFPTGFEGGYVKLVFPRAVGRPLLRSYTVRRFDAAARELELWMVVHEDGGPAARWLAEASPGSPVSVTDPGPVRRPSADADWFLLAGDLSALPALAVMLGDLPDDAQGHLVLEGVDPADHLDLSGPSGMEISWVDNPHPHAPSTTLADSVKAIPWRAGRASVWVAGEFGASRSLRQYFRHERAVDRTDLYVSCYWKIGETDEGMKQAKRNDSEAW